MKAKTLTNGFKLYLQSIRLYAIVLLLLLFNSYAFSQETNRDKPVLKDRLFYGGNFSLQLGTITNIEATPVIGIWLLPRIAVAVGPSYQFYKDPIGKTNIYGGRMYLQYVVIQDINNMIPIGGNMAVFLHGEYEGLSLETDFWSNTNVTSDRFIVNSLLTGFGISQPIGRRSSVNMMILWTLTANDYGVYDNPEIRVGFSF
jgi:hypothetical protein